MQTISHTPAFTLSQFLALIVVISIFYTHCYELSHASPAVSCVLLLEKYQSYVSVDSLRISVQCATAAPGYLVAIYGDDRNINENVKSSLFHLRFLIP